TAFEVLFACKLLRRSRKNPAEGRCRALTRETDWAPRRLQTSEDDRFWKGKLRDYGIFGRKLNLQPAVRLGKVSPLAAFIFRQVANLFHDALMTSMGMA